MTRMLLMVLTTLTLFMVSGIDGVGQDTWVKTFGGTAADESQAIAATSDGGCVVVGSTESNDRDFNGMRKAGKDIFIIKLGVNGSILWSKVLGGTGWDVGTSVATTSDGGCLITGWSSSGDGDFKGLGIGSGDIIVVKFDRVGNVLWKKSYGGTGSDEGQSITTTPEGDILITGSTTSNDGHFTGMRKGGEADIFVMRLNRNGSVLWQKVFGGTYWDMVHSIITRWYGDIVITGETRSSDGDFQGSGGYGGGIFVMKLDRDGWILWKGVFRGERECQGASVTTMLDDGIVITGGTSSNERDFAGMNNGTNDIVAAKLGQYGGVLWKTLLGGSGWDAGRSITATSDNGVLITGISKSRDGDFAGMDNVHNDVFVMKLDENGTIVWKKGFGGSGYGEGRFITTTSDQGIFITGLNTSNDGDFEGMSIGNGDIFVMKLDRNGNLKSTSTVSDLASETAPLFVTPNPLSTSSTITYTIDTPSLVRIELMNPLGQVVDVVFDGYRESGTQRLPLNVSALTSGMYSVRMTSGAGVSTAQACVVR